MGPQTDAELLAYINDVTATLKGYQDISEDVLYAFCHSSFVFQVSEILRQKSQDNDFLLATLNLMQALSMFDKEVAKMLIQNNIDERCMQILKQIEESFSQRFSEDSAGLCLEILSDTYIVLGNLILTDKFCAMVIFKKGILARIVSLLNQITGYYGINAIPEFVKSSLWLFRSLFP